MPHFIVESDDVSSMFSNQSSDSTDILDHTQNYQHITTTTASTASSSTLSSLNSSVLTQGSTIAKSRQELMNDIEQTIQSIITSISLGEPIKLPFYTRNITQKYKVLFVVVVVNTILTTYLLF